MIRLLFFIISFSFYLIFPDSGLKAQAPPDNFYHSPTTVLPYANLLLTLPNGSHVNVPFTPVLINNSPAGIENFTRDIDLRARLVFAGNGITAPDKDYNAYGTYNFQGRIPIIIYNIPADYQKRYGEKSDLHVRVFEAEQRGAVAVIVFGVPGNKKWDTPFISLPETYPPVSIPILFVSYTNGIKMLESSGVKLNLSGFRPNSVLPEFEPIEMPVIARLSVKGQFRAVETENYKVRFLSGILNRVRMQRFIQDKERAAEFIKDMFLLPEVKLEKEFITYFPDYTSLKFYTGEKNRHMNEWGDFRVLAVRPELQYKTYFEYFIRELTPAVVSKGWSKTLTRVELGLAVMTEQYARDEDDFDIDRTVSTWITSRRMIPIVEMLDSAESESHGFIDSLATASGSFMKYLWTSYSGAKFRRVYVELGEKETRKERVQLFEEIYMKDLKALEREWIERLAMKYGIPSSHSEYYLERSNSVITFLLLDRIK